MRNKKMEKFGFTRSGKRIALVLLMLVLAASGFGCSNGSSGSSAAIQSGIFVDSMVSGLEYKTETLSGVTDERGRFQYREGENIEFFIGDISIGHALAQEVVTPVDLVENANDETDPVVSNIACFLQTLDNDDNPENGIVITDEIREAAVGLSVNFETSTNEFEESQEVQQVVAVLTVYTYAGQRDLVTAFMARIHLAASLAKRDLYIDDDNDGFSEEDGDCDDGNTEIQVCDNADAEDATEEEIVTEEPVVEEPVADPLIEEPVVEEPAVEEPAVDPVVEEPAVDPLIEEPVVEEPAIDPVVEEPAVEESAVDPVVEEPVVEEPAVDPVIEEPVVEEPAVDPVVEEPVVEEPAVDPVVEEPVVEEPAVDPVVEEPVVEEPAVDPVVEEPADDADDTDTDDDSNLILADGTFSLYLEAENPEADAYKAVYITIKEISVNNKGWKVIAAPNKKFALIGGEKEALVEGVELAGGKYQEIRLVLESGDGNYIVDPDDEEQPLKVASGFTSGVKIKHSFAVDGKDTRLTLTFDASASIREKQNGWELSPVLKVSACENCEVVADDAGTDTGDDAVEDADDAADTDEDAVDGADDTADTDEDAVEDDDDAADTDEDVVEDAAPVEAVVSGIVKDADGNPVANALVMLKLSDIDIPYGVDQTDSEGKFFFDDITTLGNFYIVSGYEGFDLYNSELIEIIPGEDYNFEIILSKIADSGIADDTVAEEPADDNDAVAEEPADETVSENLSLLLTAENLETDKYEAAFITIREVQASVQSGDDTEAEWVVLGTPDNTFSLFDLRDGANASLLIEEPGAGQAGQYQQIRLVLGDVTAEGSEHPYANYIIDADGEAQQLNIPSALTSGIKLLHSFSVAEGESVRLLLTFDAAASIKDQNGWELMPVFKVNECTDCIVDEIVADESAEEDVVSDDESVVTDGVPADDGAVTEDTVTDESPAEDDVIADESGVIDEVTVDEAGSVAI